MSRRVQKPIRLYVLMIFIVLAYGILPFVSTLPFSNGFILLGMRTLPLNGSIVVLYGDDGTAPFLLVLVSLFLCVFSVASAIWAFAGYGEGRVATLIFLTLDVLWWSSLLIMAIVEGELPGNWIFSLPMQLLFPLGWLIFVWWNFLRPDVTEYYKYRSTLQDD